MALTRATRTSVITRRGHTRVGLAQSSGEARRWLADATDYRGGGRFDRAIVAISRAGDDERPRIRVRRGTPYERVDRWLGPPPSPDDPRHPRRGALLRRLPPESAARTLIALRSGIVVTLAGPASEAGRPLEAYLRVQAAAKDASAADIALVMHVADRLAPWIAVSAGDVRIETLLTDRDRDLPDERGAELRGRTRTENPPASAAPRASPRRCPGRLAHGRSRARKDA